MGCATPLIEQEALWPGARVVPGEQERVEPRVSGVQLLKPSQKSWTVPLKLTVAPLAPLMLRMVKEILQLVPLPMYTAFVTSTMGVWVAVLVDMNMNQATRDAATTAEIVISTVTIGGIPPNLLLPLATPTTLTV
jgi:hypothetical protein